MGTLLVVICALAIAVIGRGLIDSMNYGSDIPKPERQD